jgi:hypothetical protein
MTHHHVGLNNACYFCEENLLHMDCPKSPKPCGHHCNHLLDDGTCCFCGKELGEDKDEYWELCSEKEKRKLGFVDDFIRLKR